MNTAQAKKIPLREILAKLGFQPVKTFKGGEELAYLSPFRLEKEPSLFVNIRKNFWNDFGDIGGNALDFVIRYKNTDVKGALEFLDGLFGGGFPSIPKSISNSDVKPAPKESVFLLDSTLPFGTSAQSLVTYITAERKINPEIAAQYLKEVRFTNRETGKSYFAAGFENLSGGYEIRNPFFKSSLGAKDMSLVKGQGDGMEVWIFEGFLDFLSKLTLLGSITAPADCLILNSVSYAEKAIEFIRSKGYTTIKGYLDNDKAGDDATLKLKAEFAEAFFDLRSEYQGLKDINEYCL
ncbi:MAG: toprim domain-containing protein, partial [Saprospiraceae bacterium]